MRIFQIKQYFKIEILLYLKLICIIRFNYDLFGISMKQNCLDMKCINIGEKPPQDLARLLEKYTKVNDLVFDPLLWVWGICL